MSHGKLPEPRSGKSLLSVPAAEWQHLTREVRALRNMITRPPLHIMRNDAGYTLWLDEKETGGSGKSASVAIKTVIISEPIEDDATSITVWEVVYEKSPPEPPTPFTLPSAPLFYKTVGETFKAYPYLGKRASDYKDMVFNADTPNQITVFDARQVGEHWMLNAPAASGGSSIRVARILNASGTTQAGQQFLLVQPVKTEISAIGTRYEANDGSAEYVLSWPGLIAIDYTPFEQNSVFVLLVKYGDNWVAMQTVPWYMDGASPAVTTAVDDCG